MKPRSDTDSKAKPQKRAHQNRSGPDSERRAHARTSLSRELHGDEEPPADRSAVEKESTTQGSE